MEDALHYLISEYKEKIRSSIFSSKTGQNRSAAQGTVWSTRTRDWDNQNKLDSIYNACVTSLQIINVWSTYPGLQKPIDALLHASTIPRLKKATTS